MCRRQLAGRGSGPHALGRFDGIQVSPDSQPGTQQAKQDAPGQQDNQQQHWQGLQAEVALVQTGESLHGVSQDEESGFDHQPGENGAKDAIPDPAVKERPADKSVGCADQLGDDDFHAAVLDLQPDGIAHDQQHCQRQQRADDQHTALGDGQYGAQPLYPLQVQLCKLGLG